MVSETASARAWTCELRLRDGRLPRVEALSKHLVGMRVGATLRGVEAPIEGRIVEHNGALALRVRGTDESVRLAPLRHKVQLDVTRKRPQAATREELNAFARLGTQDRAVTVRVVGPLIASGGGSTCTLEVRKFAVTDTEAVSTRLE